MQAAYHIRPHIAIYQEMPNPLSIYQAHDETLKRHANSRIGYAKPQVDNIYRIENQSL